MGRPTKYTKELEEKAYEYIENFSEYGDEIPSHVGICAAIGVAKSTLYLWAEQKKGKFSDILEKCNELQERELFNKGLNGTFNSNIVKLALGKHGYHDKQDTNLGAQNSLGDLLKAIDGKSTGLPNGDS